MTKAPMKGLNQYPQTHKKAKKKVRKEGTLALLSTGCSP
jgi:hypothetical protein